MLETGGAAILIAFRDAGNLSFGELGFNSELVLSDGGGGLDRVSDKTLEHELLPGAVNVVGDLLPSGPGLLGRHDLPILEFNRHAHGGCDLHVLFDLFWRHAFSFHELSIELGGGRVNLISSGDVVR